MKKQEVIQLLEKQLNREFKKVNALKSTENFREPLTLFSSDKDGNITGLLFQEVELKKIPTMLYQNSVLCENLTHLTLLNNKLKSISNISKFKNLKKLELSCENITDISAIGELKNLIKLVLYFLRLISINFPIIKNCIQTRLLKCKNPIKKLS